MPVQVLIVDEDEKTLNDFRACLPSPAYAVETVTTLAEALERLSSRHYDVVVCEVALNSGSGFDLLARIEEMSQKARFVMITCDHKLSYVLKALKLGAFDYLRKPVSQHDLQSAIETSCADREITEEIDIQLGEAGWVELQMPSSENTMHRLDKFFRLMYEGEVPSETLEDIGICFREVVKNAIEWGHKFDVKKRVKVSHMLFQDEFVFKIEDNGDGCDISAMLEGPGDLVQMETQRESTGKRPGGLGMTMVKGLMDQVIYNEKGNMIILSKKIIASEKPV
jgi:ActR/RegA family two-component response regulator